MNGRQTTMTIEVEIGPVLSHYGGVLPSPRSGWAVMRCPFHADRLPSASVNYPKNRFHCFTCNISGDAIDVVIWKEGGDFASAVGYIKGTIGISVSGLRNSNDSPSESVPQRTGHNPRQRSIFSTRVRRKPTAGT